MCTHREISEPCWAVIVVAGGIRDAWDYLDQSQTADLVGKRTLQRLPHSLTEQCGQFLFTGVGVSCSDIKLLLRDVK